MPRPPVVSGILVKSTGSVSIERGQLSLNVPSSSLSKPANSTPDVSILNLEGKAKIKNTKVNVLVRDDVKQTSDSELYEDNFKNKWNAVKWSSDLPLYELDGKCYVLIICNIFKYGGTFFRVGAQQDVYDMQDLFESLQCDVMIKENVNEADLEGIFKRFKAKLINGGYGSCIVIIMSHGGRSANSILMENMKEKNLYRDFVYEFSHERFPEFEGKPKVFLVQACQDYGDQDLQERCSHQDQDSQMDTDSTVSEKVEKVSIRDVLVSFATTPYHPALRKNTGSFFIQAIKEEFGKYAKERRTLRAMLYKVQENVIQKCCENNCKEQNVSSFESAFKSYVFKLK